MIFNQNSDNNQQDLKFDKYSDIKDPETIFRAIWPSYWKKNGNLSPAAFKDEDGLSVDRDGDRTKEKVISDFRFVRKFSGNLVSIRAKKCREIGVYLKPDPKKWQYHVLALDSENEILISDPKCDQLRYSVNFECKL